MATVQKRNSKKGHLRDHPQVAAMRRRIGEYIFRDGFRAPQGITPEMVVEETERVKAKHGKLTGRLLLEESREESAPLHCAFEWDDSKAAEKYRINQAGQLIVSVRILTEEEPKKGVLTHIKVESSSAFETPNQVVSQEDKYVEALLKYQASIEAFRRDIEHLKRLAGDTHKPDRLASLAIAIEALNTCNNALRASN